MMDVKSMMSMDVMNFSLVGDGLGFLATVSRSSSTKEHHCPRSAWMLLCWNAFVNFIVESNRAEMQRPCKYFKFQPRLSLPNWPQNLQEIQLRLWTTASTFLVTSNFHVRCFQHQPSAQIHSRLWRIISIAHQAGSHRRTPEDTGQISSGPAMVWGDGDNWPAGLLCDAAQSIFETWTKHDKAGQHSRNIFLNGLVINVLTCLLDSTWWLKGYIRGVYIFYLILQCPQWKGGGTLSTMNDPLYHDLYNIQVKLPKFCHNS